MARHMSVTKAARELGVSPSAISHQVRFLEAFLELPLIERKGGRLHLTQHGSALTPAISTAFEVITEATTRIKHPSVAGKLTISCAPAFLTSWLIPRLPDFMTRFSEVELHLVAANNQTDGALGHVDLWIRYGDGNWPDFWVQMLAPLNLFPVASPDLVERIPLKHSSDLINHTLLHARGAEEWHTWLTAAGGPTVAKRRACFLPDAQTALEAAMQGIGVALGDNFTADRALQQGLLVAPLKPAVPALNSLFLSCRTGMQFMPASQAFIEWVTEHMRAASEGAALRQAYLRESAPSGNGRATSPAKGR